VARFVKLGDRWVNPANVTHVEPFGPASSGSRIWLTTMPPQHIGVPDVAVEQVVRLLTGDDAGAA
jgi:hypothetical protein